MFIKGDIFSLDIFIHCVIYDSLMGEMSCDSWTWVICRIFVDHAVIGYWLVITGEVFCSSSRFQINQPYKLTVQCQFRSHCLLNLIQLCLAYFSLNKKLTQYHTFLSDKLGTNSSIIQPTCGQLLPSSIARLMISYDTCFHRAQMEIWLPCKYS